MWLKIIGQNLSHLIRRAKGSASIEQKNGNGNNKGNKTNNNGAEVNRNEEQNGSLDKSQAKKKPVAPGGTPLLQQTEISTSQLDFFRMLDEKIESGPDYDESADATLRAKHVTSLLRSWELASITWSNIELNDSPSQSLKSPYQHQQPQQRLQAQQQQQMDRLSPGLQAPRSSPGYKSLSSSVSSGNNTPSPKDRESMRNIIGGRPESAPVYVQRASSANRLDGIQDVVGHHQPQHGASPNMPRHVLEAISQSPTQSLKTPPGVASPTSLSRYPHYHHPDFQPQPPPQYHHYHPQQQQQLKVTKVQYSQGPSLSPLNGEYGGHGPVYRDRGEYLRREPQQPYDTLRSSPVNPYLQKFQISASPSPQSSPLTQPRQQQSQQQQQQQQYATVGHRKRATGGYGAAQMT